MTDKARRYLYAAVGVGDGDWDGDRDGDGLGDGLGESDGVGESAGLGTTDGCGICSTVSSCVTSIGNHGLSPFSCNTFNPENTLIITTSTRAITRISRFRMANAAPVPITRNKATSNIATPYSLRSIIVQPQASRAKPKPRNPTGTRTCQAGRASL